MHVIFFAGLVIISSAMTLDDNLFPFPQTYA